MDVVDLVLKRSGARRPRSRPGRSLVRACVAAVGLVQILLTLAPVLSYPQDLHVAHEIGAWDLAFGVALLTAAASPRRAGGLVPLLAALFVLMSALAVLDVFAGRATVADEGPHLVVGASLLLLWLLDRSASGRTDPGDPAAAIPPGQPDATGPVFGVGAAVRRISPRSGRITGAA